MKAATLKIFSQLCFLSLIHICLIQAQVPADETRSVSKESAVSSLRSLDHFFDLSNEQNRSKTVLDFTNAAWHGKLEIVKTYLEAGIDINAKNKEYGNTALYAAAENEKWKTARYLLDQGADPTIANLRGRTPLLSAVEHGIAQNVPEAKELALELLAKGASINAKDNKTYMTPLFAVIEVGDEETVKAFLEKEENVNRKDTVGETLLFKAVAKCKYHAANALIEKGANVNEQVERIFSFDKVNETVLMVAAEKCDAKLINLLLDKGADVNAADAKGETALTRAVKRNDIDKIRLLVSRGADVKVRDKAGKNLLDHAQNRTQKVLLELGAARSLKQKISYYLQYFTLLQMPLLPVVFVLLYFIAEYAKEKNVVPPKRNAVTKGDNLPNLAPLKCETCGAGVPLSIDLNKCPRCEADFDIPEDYIETIKARAESEKQLKEAVKVWQKAKIYTSSPVRLISWFIAVAWLAATIAGFIGLVNFYEEIWKLFIYFISLLNGISLAAAFSAYAVFAGGTNKRLPRIPKIGKQVGKAELASCHLCGGGIEYAKGSLVAACVYCGGETYRVALTRRASQIAAKEKEKAELSLYDAMCEIKERKQEMLDYAAISTVLVYYVTIKIGFEILSNR